MKKIFLSSIVIGLVFVLGCSMNTVKKGNNVQEASAATSNGGFALIELFTSEGCSSCPPAEELTNALNQQKKEHVFILAYHIDYWDRLGWKDRFSNAAFSKRQQDYAELLHLNGIYTPQIVVNGKTEFIGSNIGKLYSSIEEAVSNPAAAKINITAGLLDNKIVVSCITAKNDDGVINCALVQLSSSTQVLRGENKGKLLQHTNIVTDLKSIPADGKSNEITFDVPVGKNFNAADYKVIAFVQHKSKGIIAVNECVIK